MENNNIKVEYRNFILGNGLKVVLSKNKRIPSISQNITFKAGSKNDFRSKSGLAHLLEHLMFEGFQSRYKKSFDEILVNRGGDNNAFTNWDLTGYYIQVPSSNLETALWLDSMRFSEVLFTEEDLKVQKKVVLEENMQMHLNVPYGSVEKESSKRLFANNGYSLPVIGIDKEIRKISLNDVKLFFNDFYTPSNASLAIVGDIDYCKTEDLINKYFSNVENKHVKNKFIFEEEHLKNEIIADFKDNVNLPAVFLFYKIPAKPGKDYYTSLVLEKYLSSGESSVLVKKLQIEKKLANEIEVYICELEYLSLLIVNIMANQDLDLNEIINEVDEVINKLKNEVIDTGELIKIKNKLETEYILKMQSNNIIAEKLSEYSILYDNPGLVNSEIDDVLKITESDIIEFAKKYLTEKRLIMKYSPKN